MKWYVAAMSRPIVPTEIPDNTDDTRVEWDCFSCGAHLGKQGRGGSFTLDFGYGSRWDMTEGINGWICDECVAQKHGRLRVSDGEKGRAHWDVTHQIPLDVHDETKSTVAEADYFGRKDWKSRSIEGLRLYHSLTAEERSCVETWVLNDSETLTRDLIIKLLQALTESEAARAAAEHKERNTMVSLFDRVRQQAKRLSADEISALRAREASLMPTDWHRIWEHTEWYEEQFDKQEERIADLEDEIGDLKAEKTPDV